MEIGLRVQVRVEISLRGHQSEVRVYKSALRYTNKWLEYINQP
jgi:hypothetical protein